MTRDEILRQVSDTLVESFEVEPSALKPESTLFDDLGLDSIDAIDLAVRMQEMTGKKVEEASLRNLETLDDVVRLIERLLAES